MPNIAIRLNLKNSKYITDTLRELVQRAEDMTAVNASIAEYMKNAARLRIARTKTAPSGKKWDPLSPTTNRLRAHDLAEKISKNEHQNGRYYVPGDILYQSGELYRSIRVGSVTAKSWEVRAESAHASYMQFGVSNTGGRVPGTRVPARPFLGFSQTNRKEILKRMLKHLKGAVSNHED